MSTLIIGGKKSIYRNIGLNAFQSGVIDLRSGGLQFFGEMFIVTSDIVIAKLIPPPRDLAPGGKFCV